MGRNFVPVSAGHIRAEWLNPIPRAADPSTGYNAVERQIYLSAFHLRPDTAKTYVDAFRRHHIQWATGYAVSFSLLAGFIYVGLPVALPSGCGDHQREAHRSHEGADRRSVLVRVFEEHAAVENCFFASECPAKAPCMSVPMRVLSRSSAPMAPQLIGRDR